MGIGTSEQRTYLFQVEPSVVWTVLAAKLAVLSVAACALLVPSSTVANADTNLGRSTTRLQLCEFTPSLNWQQSRITLPKLGAGVWLSGNFLSDFGSELALVDTSERVVSIYRLRKDSLELATSIPITIKGIEPLQSRSADSNGDGIDEIILMNWDERAFEVIFVGRKSITRTLEHVGDLDRGKEWEVADLNCDRFADILVWGGGSDYLIIWGDRDQHYASHASFGLGGNFVGTMKPFTTSCSRIVFEQAYSVYRVAQAPNAPLEVPTSTLFAHFLGYVSPEQRKYFLYGDFNGDSLQDMLLYRDRGLSRWWIAYSSGVSGLEFTGQGPPLQKVGDSTWLVGVFDAVPGDDIFVIADGGEKGILLSPEVSCEPKNGIMLLANSESVQTNAKGEIEISDSTNQIISLTLQSRGIRIFPEKVSALPQQSLLRIWSLPRGEGIDYYDWTIGHPDDGFEPTVCTGYFHTGVWRKWGNGGDCPAGYAVLTISQPSRKTASQAKVPVVARCCRVPPDLFIPNSQQSVEERCPSGFVAVGGSDPFNKDAMSHELYCREVNTRKYALGELIDGSYWGLASNLFHESRRVDILQVPLALRFGLSAGDLAQFDADGCIGKPWGSLLVEKAAGSCAKMKYQLIHSLEDGVLGEPLRFWPQCSRIANLFTPIASCEN